MEKGARVRAWLDEKVYQSSCSSARTSVPARTRCSPSDVPSAVLRPVGAVKTTDVDASSNVHGPTLKRDPQAIRLKADAIIRNTYRTLMSRGTKGCWVFACDPELNQWLKQAAGMGS